MTVGLTVQCAITKPFIRWLCTAIWRAFQAQASANAPVTCQAGWSEVSFPASTAPDTEHADQQSTGCMCQSKEALVMSTLIPIKCDVHAPLMGQGCGRQVHMQRIHQLQRWLSSQVRTQRAIRQKQLHVQDWAGGVTECNMSALSCIRTTENLNKPNPYPP